VTLEDIFLAAVEKAPADRTAYLDAACGPDAELRAQVEALLRSHEEGGSLLEQPLFRPSPTADEPTAAEQPGAAIGPYRLIEQIGEGGMGTVWMAQQTEPVKRLVAVKLIKDGMDSRQVIARFEAERQALALMDHANIARVLDAGATSAGRPYFVMDLVKGVPITRYCDEHHLTPRQRLELFFPVCQAIQHAHQKGIIHRDLKPSNVLVALYDGKPVPKIIDFGVAKAAGQSLTDKTLVTGFGAIVGTLEYMSPEQAEVNQLDVDTRSDIYSLGVLLYELLTGTTPFSRKELEKASILEMLRVIREQEPSKPSTKLTTAEGLPTLAANRGMEPAKLTRLVRGELDWIVMKALEKDRNRRYETANGFAQDIQRYLADEPVLACPPSAWYRLQKLVRRKRTTLAIAVCVLLALAATGAAACWAMRERARQEDSKRQEVARELALDGQVQHALDEATGQVVEANWPEAWAAVQRAEKLLAAAGRQQGHQRLDDLKTDLTMAMRLDEIYRYPQMILATSAATAGDSKDTSQRPGRDNRAAEAEFFSGRQQDAAFARAFQDFGIDVDALPPEEAAAQIASCSIRAALVEALGEWAPLRRRARGENSTGWKKLIEIARQADPDPLRNRCREALLRRDRQALEELADTLPIRKVPPASLSLLGLLLKEVGTPDKAVDLLKRAQHEYPSDFWVNEALGFLSWYGFQPPRTDDALRFYSIALGLRPLRPQLHLVVGMALKARGAVDDAVVEYVRAIELDPKYALAHNNLGNALGERGELDRAIACFRKVIELDPNYALGHNNLGVAFENKGELDEAIAMYRKALDLDSKLALAHSNLGHALEKKGEPDVAIAMYRKALDLDPKLAPAHRNLGGAFERKGELDEAIACYRTAIEFAPNDARCHLRLGVALHKKALRTRGSLDETIACLHKAIDLDPRYAPTRRELATTLGDAGRPDDMIAALREAIRINPKYAVAYCDMGNVLQNNKGDPDGAIAMYRKAIDIVPKYTLAHCNLGLALRTKGRLGNAIDCFQRAMEIDPKYVTPRTALGECYAHLGRWEEALAAFDEAAGLNPANHWNYFCAATVRLQTGDLAGYHGACREMLRRFGDTHDGAVAERTAKVCLLLPAAVADLDRAEKLADLGATKDPDNRWFQLVKALAEHRAGRPAEAAKWLERFAPRADSGAFDMVGFTVLAMARHGQGRVPEARAALDSAKAILHKNTAGPAKDQPYSLDWIDWLHGQVVLREAEALLTKESGVKESEKKP
jgi:tetratricopeptide (TPR) repeat protein